MISIIIPFYNSEPWLNRCADSLLNQKKEEFEFIFINDHSTDGGEKIIQEYTGKDGRFFLYSNERTRGVSGARNTGIDKAKGEWITFLDADDELLLNAWKSFREVIREDANIIQMNHVRYNTAKRKTVIKDPNSGGWYGANNLPSFWFGVWNKIFKADFLRSEEIEFKEGLQYGEDGLFVLECLSRGERIRHAPANHMAVKHRFDNKESLSHIKTGEDILGQVQEYGRFLQRQKDPVIRKATCLEIANILQKKADIIANK